jgi:hypothetical protein
MELYVAFGPHPKQDLPQLLRISVLQNIEFSMNVTNIA